MSLTNVAISMYQEGSTSMHLINDMRLTTRVYGTTTGISNE